MKKGDGVKRFFGDFFLIQAETTLAMAIIGSIFAADVPIDFRYFFLPSVIGIICMLPCIPLYLKEDLSMKGVIAQRIVEWIVLEGVILVMTYFILGTKIPRIVYPVAALSILILDVATYWIGDYLERREIDDLNDKLKQWENVSSAEEEE